jgi:predicted TPR repeat methyltransferase
MEPSGENAPYCPPSAIVVTFGTPASIAGGQIMGRGREFLDRIYALEEESEVRSFYDDAARQYDEILLSEIGYISPNICAHAIAPYLPDRESSLIDLGCGTGLAGKALSILGYENIDGVDFSTEMLAVAKARNCYSKLEIADLNAVLDIPSDNYAAAVSVGVFGQHVLPAALDECIRIVEPGGLVCFSVNERAFDDYGFRAKVEALNAEGSATTLSLSKEAYHVNEKIDGWVCLLRIKRYASP